jgi:hypothetical protein
VETALTSLAEITSQEISAFKFGDCWLLASVLNKLTGFPIYAIGKPKYSSENLLAKDSLWDHVFVELPNGQFLDIEGVADKETLSKNWTFSGGEVFYVGEKFDELVWDQAPIFPEVDIEDNISLFLVKDKRNSPDNMEDHLSD